MKVNEKQQEHLQPDHHHLWWRSPLLGYPFSVLFVAAAFLIPLSERSLGIQDFFEARIKLGLTLPDTCFFCYQGREANKLPSEMYIAPIISEK